MTKLHLTFWATTVVIALTLYTSHYSGSAEDLKIYYLSVGSAHFAQDDKNPWNLPQIDAALRGARRVADLLDQHGARYGIVLTSESNNTFADPSMKMVSKGDIFAN